MGIDKRYLCVMRVFEVCIMLFVSLRQRKDG